MQGSGPKNVNTSYRLGALAFLMLFRFFPGQVYAQESPFPEIRELAGKRTGAIILKGGRLYQNRVDFGLIQVPENRSNRHSRPAPLPFIRHHARKDHSAEPLFVLGGGPGKSNLWSELPDAFYAHNDLVNIGYRGVDGEVKLKCPEIGAVVAKDSCLSHQNLLELRKTLRKTYDKLVGDGVDLDGYNMLEVVEDLEAIRQALGYEKINLFSTSYGTQLAYLYCVRYPRAAKRSMMVGASSRGRRFDSLWEPDVIDTMLREYNTLWKSDPEASTKSPDIIQTMGSVLSALPTTWNNIRIDPDKLRLATFFSLYETGSAAAVFDAFVAAQKGDPGGLALLVLGYEKTVQDPSRQYWGDFVTKLASGGMAPTRDYETDMDPPGSVLGSPSAKLWLTAISQGGWPVAQIPKRYLQLESVRVQTLIINGELDFSSPPRNILEVKPYFTNCRILIMPTMGHMDVFRLQPGAIDHMAERFYLDGVIDASKYAPHKIDFSPTETYQDEAKKLFKK